MNAYEMAGIKLCRQNGKYALIEDGAVIPAVDAEWEENPILAWDRFIGAVDSRVRRRIGDYLESQGLDRHTGEPKT